MKKIANGQCVCDKIIRKITKTTLTYVNFWMHGHFFCLPAFLCKWLLINFLLF